MSMKVTLGTDAENTIEAQLEMLKDKDGNLIVLKDQDGTPLMTEMITQYHTLVIDPENSLHITLGCDSGKRSLTFSTNLEQSEFIEFIQSSAVLDLIPGKDRAFAIKHKKQTPGFSASSVAGFVGNTLTGGYKMVKSMVTTPGKTDQTSGVNSTDGITLGHISTDLPDDFKVQEVNNDDLFKPMQIWTANLKKPQILSLWLHYLGTEPNKKSVDDYLKLKLQWGTITKGQWDHSYCLRKYIFELENAIKKCHLCVAPYDQLIFDVMMALYTFNFMKIDFNPLYIEYIELFIKLIISDYQDNRFLTSKGDEISFDEASSLLFWTFKAFLKKIPEQKSLFLAVNAILSTVSPSTADVLRKHNITSFDFASKEISLLYTRDRSTDDAILLITAFICAKNSLTLLETVTAGALILTQARMQQCDSQGAKDTFIDLIPSISARLLLMNAEKLIGNAE